MNVNGGMKSVEVSVVGWVVQERVVKGVGDCNDFMGRLNRVGLYFSEIWVLY